MNAMHTSVFSLFLASHPRMLQRIRGRNESTCARRLKKKNGLWFVTHCRTSDRRSWPWLRATTRRCCLMWWFCFTYHAKRPIHHGRVYSRENEIRRIDNQAGRVLMSGCIGVKKHYIAENLDRPWPGLAPTKLRPCLRVHLWLPFD
jgi:hypothetical protein